MSESLNTVVRWGYRAGYLMLRAWWFLRRPRTHGAVIALWHEGRVLMVRTSYRNCCSLPGGFVRQGESSEQAARRELREELGIDLPDHVLRRAWTGTLTFESREDTVDIWEAPIDQAPVARVVGREIVWAGWLSPSEALAQPHLPHIAAYLAQRR